MSHKPFSESRIRKNEERVLEAVRNPMRAANIHCKLAPAVSEYARATSLLPISKLEYWERTFRHEIWLESHSRYKLFPILSRRLLLPWLDFCSGDGYRRERAFHASSEDAPNGFLFAIVLRRLNDWVPQVRAAAREHVPAMAANTQPKHILEALWAILILRHNTEVVEPSKFPNLSVCCLGQAMELHVA